MPSEAFGGEHRRVIIGETYHFDGVDGGIIGTVTAATVNEPEKLVLIGVTGADGKSRILSEPMADDQLADYRIHGDAYFGRVREVENKHAKNDFELFEWFVAAYRKLTRAQLVSKLAPIFKSDVVGDEQ